MVFDPDWKEREIPPETQVVNMRYDDYEIYMGREGKGQDGYFGNSHVIGYCRICRTVHDRVSCIAAFKKDFNVRIVNDPEYRERVLKLRGRRLGCFCKPLACHADVIKEWLDSNPNLK